MTPDEIEAGLKVCDAAWPNATAYQQICAERCVWCARKTSRLGHAEPNPVHKVYPKDWPEFVTGKFSEYFPCTAPSQDDLIAELQLKAIHASEAERKVTEERNRLEGLRLEDEGRIAAARKVLTDIPDSLRYHMNKAGWRSCQACDSGEFPSEGYDPHDPSCPWNYVRLALAALAAPAPTGKAGE